MMTKTWCEKATMVLLFAFGVAGVGCVSSELDIGGDSDGSSDADGDTDNDGDADSDTDNDGDTDSDTDSDADTDADSDIDSDTDTDTDSDSDTDTDTDTDSDTDTGTDSDTGSDTDTGTGPDTDTGTGPDTDTGTGPDTDTGTGPDTDTGTGSDTEVVCGLPIVLASWDSGDEGWSYSANWVWTSSGGSPGGYLRFDDSPAKSYYSIALTSPATDLSACSSASVSYDAMLDDYVDTYAYYDEYLRVQCSGNGSSWTTLASYVDGDDWWGEDFAWTAYSHALPVGCRTATAYIRFLAEGDDSWDIDYWGVDEVSLTGS